MVKFAVVTNSMSIPSGFNSDLHVLPRLTFVQLEHGGAKSIRVPGPGDTPIYLVEALHHSSKGVLLT